jgi:hypothetical protein
MNYSTFIFLLAFFNCFSQIIDKSKDVYHTNYKVELPSKQYSEEDFSLLTQYAFTSGYKGHYVPFMHRKNIRDIHYSGDRGYKGYHERKIDLSNQKIILRRYAFFEIDVITNLPFRYRFEKTKKLAVDETSKIINLLKEEINIESFDLNELQFVEFDEFSLISNNILEDNLENFSPIKFSFNNFSKYRREYEEIGKVLNKTLTNEIVLTPIKQEYYFKFRLIFFGYLFSPR